MIYFFTKIENKNPPHLADCRHVRTLCFVSEYYLHTCSCWLFKFWVFKFLSVSLFVLSKERYSLPLYFLKFSWFWNLFSLIFLYNPRCLGLSLGGMKGIHPADGKWFWELGLVGKSRSSRNKCKRPDDFILLPIITQDERNILRYLIASLIGSK